MVEVKQVSSDRGALAVTTRGAGSSGASVRRVRPYVSGVADRSHLVTVEATVIRRSVPKLSPDESLSRVTQLRGTPGEQA